MNGFLIYNMKTALILLVVGHLVMTVPLESPEKTGQSKKSEKTGQNETESGGNGTENVCVSRDCISTAYNLMNRMNLTADPCDDFYEVIISSVPQFIPSSTAYCFGDKKIYFIYALACN